MNGFETRIIESAGNTDLLKFDFFSVADQPIEKVRAAFNIPDKSDSVSQWDPEGASHVPA